MATIKILIVEDEIIIATDISMVLTQLGYEIVGIIARGEDALSNIQSSRPDLVLMDITLRGQMDGIETAHLIRENLPTPLIFLTSNIDKPTFERAKAVRPYAFITKPFQPEDLHRAIELAMSRMEDEVSPQPESQVETDSKDTYILADRIFVKHKDHMVKIFLRDILYVEADRSYCKIHTEDQTYLLSMSLGAFTAKLNTDTFMRVHRSHIVNLLKIDSVGDNYGHVVIGRKLLSVSSSYQDDLAERLRVI